MRAFESKQPDVSRILVLGPLFLALAWSLGAIVASNDAVVVRAAFFLSTIVIVSLLLFWVVARADPEGRALLVILLVSLMLKLLAMCFRFYAGLLSDAYDYHNVGAEFAGILSRGRWPEGIQYGGTDVIRLLTGLVYFVTGETMYGISILWAWFGLLGMLFFYKAFITAFPGGHRRIYMYLIFLYPSMLLWTSSLGKDAAMVMLLGMGAYGVARLQQRIELIGAFWLGLGLFGMLMIRPHIAALFALSAGLASLFRPIRAGMMTPLLRLAGVLLFAAVAAVVVSTAADYIRLESLATEDVLSFIEYEQGQSQRGGSAFEQVSLRSNPVVFLVNIPTIFFRPYPWEALSANRSTFALIASLEGLGLFLLFVFRWHSVRTAVATMLRNSYVMFALAYIVVFVFIFSAVANFGIIARQRSSLFPFVFMLIAFLGPARWRGGPLETPTDPSR